MAPDPALGGGCTTPIIETPPDGVVFVTGGAVWVTGGTELGFVDEGVLTGTDTSGRLGRGLDSPELVDDVGLWLAEPLVSQVGVGESVSVSDAEGSEVAPDGSVAVGGSVGVDVSVTDEVGEPVGLTESVGVGEPVQGLTEAAIPGLAGTTSSAPSATVPVATTPTTDAADRFVRVCFGTVQTPQFSPCPCISDHAPTGPTVPP